MLTRINRSVSARRALLTALCGALLFPGCAPVSAPVAAPSPTPQETPAPAPTPAPTPVPEPDYDALSEKAEQAFRDAFTVDLSAIVLPEMEFMTDLMAEFDVFLAMGDAVEAAAHKAYAEAFAAVSLEYVALPAGEFQFEQPEWQMLMGLYRALGDKLDGALSAHCTVSATLDRDSVHISASFAGYEDCIGDDSAALFSFKNLYAYLNTIYDDEGVEKEYAEEPLSDDYLMALADPLPGRRIKDGWYAGRSGNTRKHTGTDIRASADEPILSCTGGTVLHIGYGDIAGNYVVVLDEAGYEYHYYHMIRMTDFLSEGDRVEAGEVIGHVGDTGNSDANHLHLAVITPQMTYRNPYPMLYAMRQLHRAAG